MSLKALPLVFINLGGEMMYILDQRLTAQNIALDKAEKVLVDIVDTMLSAEFIDELFKPQQLYSFAAMKSVFEKLVHSSIMKLNGSSMDKLYDLMTMVFKYQVWMCPTPYDLIFVTLNHLDAIRRFVASSPVTAYLVDCTHAKLIKHYGSLTTGEMQMVRGTILDFFQDLKIRVSVFLKEGLQNQDGSFVIPTKDVPVPHGTEIPGSITEYDADGQVLSKSSFDTGAEYLLPRSMGSLEIIGDRGTTLGCNIYSTKLNPEGGVESAVSVYDTRNLSTDDGDADTPPPVIPHMESSRGELTLLADLIGISTTSKAQFMLNLFSPEQDEQGSKEKEIVPEMKTTTFNIDGSKQAQNEEFQKILSDMTFEKLEIENTESDDRQELLDLMDSTM